MSMTANWYIHSGRIIDPSINRDETADIYVEDGLIKPLPSEPPSNADILDASGLIVSPGLMDMHVHLREPGRESAETIESGTTAADSIVSAFSSSYSLLHCYFQDPSKLFRPPSLTAALSFPSAPVKACTS